MFDHDFQANFEQVFFNHLYNYDFAITRGLMAWVPRGSQPGDVLCFFNGVGVPFLLCPAGVHNSGQQYFTRDAYVRGLMHEEAKELNVAAMWFKII